MRRLCGTTAVSFTLFWNESTRLLPGVECEIGKVHMIVFERNRGESHSFRRTDCSMTLESAIRPKCATLFTVSRRPCEVGESVRSTQIRSEVTSPRVPNMVGDARY